MSKSTRPYSQLRGKDRPDLANQLPLRGPLSIYLETTNVCNFKCRQCPVSFDDYYEKIGGRATIDLQRYETLLCEIVELGRLKSLKFYSEGEPFLNKNLPGMISRAIKSGACEYTEVTTNGSALSPNTSKEIVESGLHYLRVSIYSVDQERHKFITQTNISINKIHSNIETFINIRKASGSKLPFLYVKMIDPKSGEAEEFRKRYESLADEIAIEQPMNWNGYENRDLVNANYSQKYIQPAEAQKQVCPFAFYSLVIKANGDVVICCVDWNKDTCVGNINRESLKDIWTGNRMRAFRLMQLERRKGENKSCKNCTYIDTTPDNLDNIHPEMFKELL